MSDLEMQEESRGGGCMKPLLIGCGVLFLLAIVGLVTMGVLIQRGVITFQEPTLLSGDEVPEGILADLRESLLEEGETVVWFSGVKIFSANLYGNVLTDRRVVFYTIDDDADALSDFAIQAVALGDVHSIEAEFSDSAGVETMISVAKLGEAGVREVSVLLMLPGDDSLDHRFVEDLAASAREAGAEIESITFGGDVSDAEIEVVEGAVRGDVAIEVE